MNQTAEASRELLGKLVTIVQGNPVAHEGPRWNWYLRLKKVSSLTGAFLVRWSQHGKFGINRIKFH